MAAPAQTINQDYNASKLIETYNMVTPSSMRDLYANFIVDHTYQVHSLTQANMGYTPYSPDTWQNWENLCKDKADQKKYADKKVKVQKTKPDPADPSKKIKIEGEYEEKEKRLNKTTTFNAPGKVALACLITALTHEALMALPKVTKSDITSIKNDIMENAQENLEYCVSPLLFAICDKYEDSVINEMFVDIHGSLVSKLDNAIDKHIKDTNVRNVVSGTFVKFLKIFTIHIASTLWFETKESENEQTKDRVYTGKGTTTSDKQIRQFLMLNSNVLLKGSDKIGGQFFEGMNEFYDALVAVDNKNRAENKATREAKLLKKSSEKSSKEKNAVKVTNSESDEDKNSGSESEDEEEEAKEEVKELPKKTKVAKVEKVEKVEKEEKEDESAEPVVLTSAPTTTARRRRMGTK